MADTSRLEDLRRRVQKDPASIAFAQLAEEYRRAGQSQEAVDVCRAGLALHPGYLSARVTLGRALLELNDLAAARTELEQVLKSAPENLAAIRGLAEVLHRSGALQEALAQYRAALALAKNDPDLEQTVADLTSEVAASAPAPPPIAAARPAPAAPIVESAVAAGEPAVDPARESARAAATRTIEALEHFLAAVHVARADRVA